MVIAGQIRQARARSKVGACRVKGSKGSRWALWAARGNGREAEGGYNQTNYPSGSSTEAAGRSTRSRRAPLRASGREKVSEGVRERKVGVGVCVNVDSTRESENENEKAKRKEEMKVG